MILESFDGIQRHVFYKATISQDDKYLKELLVVKCTNNLFRL